MYDVAGVDRFLALVAGTATYAVPFTTVEEVVRCESDESGASRWLSQ